VPVPPDLPPGASPLATRTARRLLAPIQRFLAIEAASGIVLILTTVVAMVWANSPWRDQYTALWHTTVAVRIGDWHLAHDLHFLVNDALMTIFFFVVGLEIRREMHGGELSDLRRAALPIVAAIGGMLVPAGLYLAFNHGRASQPGWGVPMATDIAFAVGVLTLLSTRVTPALKVLLLALAVIDDIGAIVVIALFYSAGIDTGGLGMVALGVAGVLVLQQFAVRATFAYVGPGVVVWAGLLEAGIHPTLAGVLLGLMTPARAWLGRQGFADSARDHALRVEASAESHEVLASLDEIERARREAVSPVEHLQHLLHPWVAFGIMPLFALANAGVELGGADLEGAGLWCLVGIVLGLAVGKPLGVLAASYGFAAAGVATIPRGTTRSGVLVVGVVAGIGFTMALFIASLAFPPGPMLATAKLAILLASLVAGLLGLALGALALRPPPRGVGAADEVAAERSTDD